MDSELFGLAFKVLFAIAAIAGVAIGAAIVGLIAWLL